ncbi:hypothetical protein HMSSN036_47020 [Paenibacillus macerans]|nr:hypothetical protein HMSSN036_47020 [Paenibacillus macerans]
MRIKTQVAMVMNLDKCIGCHTCSVTCKNTWTNRPGTEYMWYNNVETRPGPGYPKEWEETGKYKGGWVLRGGKLALRAGGPITKLANIFTTRTWPIWTTSMNLGPMITTICCTAQRASISRSGGRCR